MKKYDHTYYLFFIKKYISIIRSLDRNRFLKGKTNMESQNKINPAV